MVDLNLDFDEGVILETEEVHRSGRENSCIKNMILTNKNIIYVTSQKTGGLFSKSVDVVDKIPLSEVKVINGKVFVNQKKTDLFEYVLQIQFISGTEEYSYSERSKKITSQWVNELNKLLGNEQPAMTERVAKKNDLLDGLSGLASSVGSMAGALGQIVSSAAKQVADQASTLYANAGVQAETEKQEQEQEETTFQQVLNLQAPSQTAPQTIGSFCINCGTKLDSDAKFCPECGTVVSTSESNSIYTSPDREILKVCPKCGEKMPSDAFYCLNCGTTFNEQQDDFSDIQNRVKKQFGTWKNKWKALLLCIFFGWMGAHKYYERKIWMGIIYTFTLGLFFIGWIVDIVILAFKPNPYMVK